MSNEQREFRIRKLEQWKQRYGVGYRDRFETTHDLTAARALPDGAPARVAGRLLTMRGFGKLIFATLQDRGGKLQVSFDKGKLPAEAFDTASKLLDLGDFIGVRGELWTTRTGERTVQTLELMPLAKALRPLPEKWHGLADRDACYRQRYLDLIANDATRERFILRSKIVSFIRRFLDAHGFLEVETPILQAASSGAAARPFVTHHNALDRDFFLRISPETYLKRLMVGGLERVYEIGKNFRNEGIDPSHLQEFTMLEWYAAYWNYRDNMKLIRELIQGALSEFKGGTKVTVRGIEIDFGGEWPEIDYLGAVKEKTGIDLAAMRDEKELAKLCAARWPDLGAEQYHNWPALVDALYKRTVRPGLIQPCFVLHHPTEMVPLARRSDANPAQLDMFQVVANTWEIVKAYSELVDPIDQHQRMVEQQEYREKGDDETMMMEDDYIVCMEHGMPPQSGLGLGIDRFVALITDAESLRDVVYFPTLREELPPGAADAAAEEKPDAEKKPKAE